MRTFRLLGLVAVAATLVGCAAETTGPTFSRIHCYSGGDMYSEGAISCQRGEQFACSAGDWVPQHIACGEPVAMGGACQYQGISFSTGSASCQAGTQYRCDNGRWASLGMTCPIADAPIRIVPSGRTCMYGGATVASGSTLCRSGSTFLCNDGEWSNLGTMCQ